MNTVVAPPLPRRGLRALLARYRTFLLYAVIGGGALLLDIGLYALLVITTGLHPVLANTASVLVAMVFSFAANSLVNFKVRDRIVARFLSFVLVTGAGYLVSTVVLAVLTDGFRVDPLLAKAVTLPIVLLLQYSLNKKITFATRIGRTAA